MKIGVEIKRLRLKSLQETLGNPQSMDDATFKGLVKSMKQKKWLLDPPTVWLRPEGKHQIISGHHRVKAAIAAGILETDCKVLKGIDEGMAKKLVLEANQRRGSFDEKALNEFIDGIIEDTGEDKDSLLADIGVLKEINDEPEGKESKSSNRKTVCPECGAEF